MESTDQYNFSLFRPRNLHGKKNRNVIISMLIIWAVAVFGFQLLLRIIEKPTPEKSLVMFESTWPSVLSGDLKSADYKIFLRSLVLVKGKNIVKPGDQQVLSGAISYVTFNIVADDVKTNMLRLVGDLNSLRSQLTASSDQDYIGIKTKIEANNKLLADLSEPFSGFKYGSLESAILIRSLQEKYPGSLSEITGLPAIMKLYLTHNQSVLTDSKFMGFPFHYFYTAVFLLILFVILCIVYNILIEWRLKKEGIVE